MGPIEPVAITAATLLATKALESLGGQAGTSAWAGLERLAGLVRRKVTGHQPAEDALAEVERHPGDQNRVRALAETLAAFGAQDVAFQRELVTLVADARGDPVVGSLATRVYGGAQVGQILNLAQARDIYLQPAPPPAPAEQGHWPTGGRTVSNLPPRGPSFTGREAELAALQRRLGEDAGQPLALHGLGGVGKTQLALEFAHRQAPSHDVAWWVAAQQPATIPRQLVTLARRIGIPDHAEQAEVLSMLADELRKRDRWLLVFDNAEQPRDLRPYLPSGGGNVLVTSRNPAWGGLAVPVRVHILRRLDAVRFLGRRAAVASGEADALAAALGDLPLALEQAAAYLEETGVPVAEYLALLGERSRELFSLGEPATSEETIATIWKVSLDRIRAQVPTAQDLLALCSFLGADDLPRALFTSHPQLLPGPLAAAVDDQLELQRAVAELRRYSLVTVDDDAISMHRLVQAVVRHDLDPADQGRWATIAVRLLVAAFPEDAEDVRTWPIAARLLPHALAAVDHATALGAGREETATLLHLAGHYLAERAEDAQARDLHERGLAIREADLGPDHPRTANSLLRLARVLHDQGDFQAARPLIERALAIREGQPGPEHRDRAHAMTSLARLVHNQGDLRGARALNEQALAIFEASKAADHPDIALSLTALAAVLRGQGELDQARDLLERALAIRGATFGPDHPAVAWSLHSLARVLHNQGDYQTARGLYERALVIFETSLGPDHPKTAHCITNLARAMYAQGHLDVARELHQRALATREARLGPEHPDTAWSLNNLGVILRDDGDLDGARRLHQRALAIREARLGLDHPDTAYSLINIARLCRDDGQLPEARRLLEQALVIFQADQDVDNFNTAWTRHELAAVLQLQGELPAARHHYKQALAFRKRYLGDDHPETTRTRQVLAVLAEQGDQ
jgi:tetratricopeptide (TPR) repeat protein